jgi:hypothetical protein
MKEFFTKYKYVIIPALVLLVIGTIIGIIIISNRNTKGTYKTTVDPDTGEELDISDRSIENGGNNSSGVVVIGLTLLAKVPDVSMNTQQVMAFRDDLASKGIKSLDGYTNLVKVINPVYDTQKYQIVADLKYNNTNNYAKVYITINSAQSIAYTILLDGKTVYSSGNIKVNY